MMRFPTHVTMNTYATSARFCAYADRGCNRLCTPEELPGVLRTGPYSEIVPEYLPRSEKGGDPTIHGQSTDTWYKRFKTQPSKEGSQEAQSRDDLLLPVNRYRRQWRISEIEPEFGSRGERTTRVNQRVYTRCTSKTETVDNKNHPSEIRVTKENLDKIQNEMKTKNLSNCWLHRTRNNKTR